MVRELLEAYTIGALDADEQVNVASHLAGCADCQHLANEYTEVASMFPQAVFNAAPLQVPASIKDNLLHAIKAAPGSLPSEVRDTTVPFSPPRSAPADLSRGVWQSLFNLRLPLWRRLSAVSAWVIIILFVISFAGSIGFGVTLVREQGLRAEFASLVSQQELILEVIDSNKTVRRVLLPPQKDSRSYGKLFTRSDMPHVVAMAARLSQPPSDQAYHIWVKLDDEIRLAGTLDMNSQGFGILVFDADRDGPSYEEAYLILQPQDSPFRADDPILHWETSH